MSAKRSSDRDDLPAPSCYVPRAELDAAKAQSKVIDLETAKVVIRPLAVAGTVISFGSFLIYCTLAVSNFMHEMRAFQLSTTEALRENGEAIREVADKLNVVTQKQNNVIGDRWRFSDMQPWAFKLEQANRGLLREDGRKGLVVPEAVAKQQEPN